METAGLRLFCTEAAAGVAAQAGGGGLWAGDAAWMGVGSGNKVGFSATAGLAGVDARGCCSAAGSCTSCKEGLLPSMAGGCLLTAAVSARLFGVPRPCSGRLAAGLPWGCTPSLVVGGSSPVLTSNDQYAWR